MFPKKYYKGKNILIRDKEKKDNGYSATKWFAKRLDGVGF